MPIEIHIKMEIFSRMIATALNIAVHQVENTLSLLNGGATIPFISRYRKEATGGLDEVQIGEIKERYDKLTETAKRKETIRNTIWNTDCCWTRLILKTVL